MALGGGNTRNVDGTDEDDYRIFDQSGEYETGEGDDEATISTGAGAITVDMGPGDDRILDISKRASGLTVEMEPGDGNDRYEGGPFHGDDKITFSGPTDVIAEYGPEGGIMVRFNDRATGEQQASIHLTRNPDPGGIVVEDTADGVEVTYDGPLR